MKHKNFALITILALVIFVASPLELTNLVNANFYPVPSLYVYGPSFNGSQGNSVSVKFSVEAHVSMDTAIVSISHSIDGSANISSTDLRYATWFPGGANAPNNHNQYFAVITLDKLSYGNHTLRVYTLDAEGGVMSTTRNFTVAYPTISSTPTQSTSSTALGDNSYALDLSILVISIIGILAISSLGLLVYFKRYRKLTNKERI